MTTRMTLQVNGEAREVQIDATTPLLYVLRNELELRGAKFGCGLGECGACTALVDGRPVRTCVTATGAIGERSIVTIEGLGSAENPHPLQQAFIDEQAAQCAYCISGMIMTAKALLERKASPSDADIRNALSANLCGCGTHLRIVRAVQRAAGVMRGETAKPDDAGMKDEGVQHAS
ncbi:(2Fe-2S)-binding protein [Allohahella marinimesophila]|uniref:(2Fe-2S)-binding protein n=1 Tax=Allohahella marinimesophila TaxID=1054972 RepID=A0ABP7PIH4_9GAMM